MIHNSVISDRYLDPFRSLLAVASLPVIAFTCLAAHACAPSTTIAEVFIVLVLLLGQIVLVTCLESRNTFLFSVMQVSLLAKVASAWLQVGMARWGVSDQLMYFYDGSQLAATSNTFFGVFDLENMWGTQLIVSVTACLFKLIGPSFIAAMIVFSIISFWGQYLYYLTFRIKFPRANLRFAALGLFMWPSMIFWPSELGKDALMLFLLGLSSYCMAKLTWRKTPTMFILLAVGVLGSFLIRPHIATLLIISIVASLCLKRPIAGTSSAYRKVITITLLSFFSILMVYLCAQFLQLSNIVEARAHMEASVQSNQLDGSGFDPGKNLASRIFLAPLLLVRPFPWEINGIAAALTSAEGILLLALVFYQRKRLGIVLKTAKVSGFLVFMLWFVSLNVLLLGIGSSNFGLLARQRVMVLPMIIMMLSACTYGKGIFPWGRNIATSTN